ncbi:MAG TPA: cytochrome c biogenesis protein CcdA [Holophagaceae bacterium]|nr:cytochrome c biogenesis protein CcdA [Holophagaceae bacterium]
MTLARKMTLMLLAAAGMLCSAAQRAPGLDPRKDIGLAFQKGAVVLTVPEGAHLKAAFMKVEKQAGAGTLTAGPLPATDGVDELGDPVWHGTVRIPLKGDGAAGTITLAVTYQPCTEGEGGVCYAPTTRTLDVDGAQIPRAKAAKAPEAKAAESKAAASAAAEPRPVEPKAAEPTAPSLALVAAPPAPAAAPNPSSGLLWLLIQAFGFGIAASLTPCVLPMIPITMAIVGAKGGGKLRGLLLSLTLVLGMAATYSVLGVFAARTGAAFGAAAQKPSFLVPVAILFALLALSMFGAFEMRLPAALQTKLQGGARKGFGGAFIMGLILGPISAPCVGPFIGAQLIQIAQRGETATGALTLFIFALGMGVLFVVGGTFSAALPRSGDWLTRFKQCMGLVVLGFAVWSLRYILPPWANWALWSATALLGAAVLGAFEPAMGLLPSLRRGVAILSLAAGVLLGLRAVETGLDVKLLPGGGSAEAPKASIWLEQDLEKATAQAKASKKLVLVDIYAEWCAQCHELDEKTWPDPNVQAWIAQHAVAVRIDTDKVRPDLAVKLKVLGYPTVLLLDGDGRELRRFSGFEKPEGMLKFLNGA